MRVVLIACDEGDALRWIGRQPALGHVDVLWVGPRAPDRARGQNADAVLVTDLARLNLTDGQFAVLLEQTLPSIATSSDVVTGRA